jgi:hypothetical protein
MLSISALSAQTDFSGLKIKIGQITYVTSPDDTQISGRLTGLSPAALSIDGYQFQPLPGMKIERRGDPIWDGAVSGLAAGLFFGMLTASGECGVDWSSRRCIAAGGMWGAVIGAGIDFVHVGRTTVRLFRPATRARAATALDNDRAAR